MSSTDKIRQLVRERPGLKARQIAAELGLDRSRVAAALHGLDAAEVVQDAAYRWWPKTGPAAIVEPAAPSTLLTRLSRYYLECLARESGSGISLRAAAADAEWTELERLPFGQEGIAEWAGSRSARKVIRKARQERGQLTLYVGYALRLRTVRMGDEEEMRIEPVLLYPLEEGGDEPGASPSPPGGIPLFNLEVLKSLLAVDSGNLLDEAISLSEELGLANADEDLPAWDEIVLRLAHCRPEWDWREPLDPHALASAPPLAALRERGIYNRAVLFAAPRSPFTYGLETELRKLSQLDEETVRPTALGMWLRGETGAAGWEDRPLLEVVPLNGEQRQAVAQGLAAPLTVVTGPPGTGKSQVVLALLANMAWQGGSVLFASKNNHAVDVVEARANEIGAQPLLLRLGKEEHHARLAGNLAARLADSASADDLAAYRRAVGAWEEAGKRHAAAEREIAAVIKLRNRVDQLEREAEPARALFGATGFAELRGCDAETGLARLGDLGAAIEHARQTGGEAVGRLLRGRRLRRVGETAAALSGDAERLGVTVPAGWDETDDLAPWERFHEELAGRLEQAARARAYLDAFEELRRARPLEQLAGEVSRIAQDSAGDSLELWRRWLRLWPSRWGTAERRLLSEYVALLQMIGGERFDEGAGRKVFRRYYHLFAKVTRILPCWAVTSLSARGRLPFEPALFDLVIIDEASQCDIASALPLLYRAKRAVIIGDPLQMKHVSTVAPREDRILLSAHGLAEGHAAWAYSVNSLFDAARSLCRHEDIVNLRDHHRSHRDIIRFSNEHFYRGGLRVATDHETLKRPCASRPAVRWEELRGRVYRPPKGGAMNAPEAEAVVAALRKMIVGEAFGGSIGVVTPFRAQANRIRTLVHQDSELAGRLTALQFVVDTVHGFQGDERDVIIFSPVVSLGIGESTLRFLKNHGNLFNVAVTRARSELVVVGDREAALGSGVAYLRAFAEYAEALRPPEGAVREAAPGTGPEYPPVSHPELVSEWERVFYKALYRAGLRPVPQFEEAPYTLDFALFADDRKLDIEVDGENYHRDWDGEVSRRDQIRSRRLADLGWDVRRFWVYEIRDDLEGSVARVAQWVAGGRGREQ